MHEVKEAAIIGEELKLRMVEIVKKDLSAPVGEAINAIKEEMAKEYVRSIVEKYSLRKWDQPCSRAVVAKSKSTHYCVTSKAQS